MSSRALPWNPRAAHTGVPWSSSRALRMPCRSPHCRPRGQEMWGGLALPKHRPGVRPSPHRCLPRAQGRSGLWGPVAVAGQRRQEGPGAEPAQPHGHRLCPGDVFPAPRTEPLPLQAEVGQACTCLPLGSSGSCAVLGEPWPLGVSLPSLGGEGGAGQHLCALMWPPSLETLWGARPAQPLLSPPALSCPLRRHTGLLLTLFSRTRILSKPI